MFLAVLTLLGSKAFMSTTVDLQIGSGYRQGLQALYAAEAGLQQLVASFRANPVLFLLKKTASELNFPIAEPAGPNFQTGAFWIQDLRYDSQPVPEFAEVILTGKAAVGLAVARIRATLYCTASNPSPQTGTVYTVRIGAWSQM
jgi:hypothetical protein